MSIHDAILDIETEIDGALDRFKKEIIPAPDAASTTSATAPGDTFKIPETGWTSFKSGKGIWIRSEEAKDLAGFLAKAEKKTAIIGDYVYKLSGADGQFVNRFVHSGASK